LPLTTTMASQKPHHSAKLRVLSPHILAWALLDDYIPSMCGRVLQSSGPLRYAIVDGMNVRDSRVHNYPPRWNEIGGLENPTDGECYGSEFRRAP
jgi:hypothetical protein